MKCGAVFTGNAAFLNDVRIFTELIQLFRPLSVVLKTGR
jgi:hypothetical protein